MLLWQVTPHFPSVGRWKTWFCWCWSQREIHQKESLRVALASGHDGCLLPHIFPWASHTNRHFYPDLSPDAAMIFQHGQSSACLLLLRWHRRSVVGIAATWLAVYPLIYHQVPDWNGNLGHFIYHFQTLYTFIYIYMSTVYIWYMFMYVYMYKYVYIDRQRESRTTINNRDVYRIEVNKRLIIGCLQLSEIVSLRNHQPTLSRGK